MFLFGRSKPSPYPLLPFHLLRIAQLLSALITTSILSYFVWHLRNEGYPVPWTFIFLLAASTFSIPLFLLSHYVHTVTPHTSPRRSLFLHLPLSVLWLLGLALLTWNLSYTLGHRCTISQWRNEAGIMVCRMYKALTSFAVTGAASTIGVVLLDWKVWRGMVGGGRGGYGMVVLPSGKKGYAAGAGPNGAAAAAAAVGAEKKNGKKNEGDGTRGGVWRRLSDGPEGDEYEDEDLRHGNTGGGDAFQPAAVSATSRGREQRAGVRIGALWDSESKGFTRPWKARPTIEVEDFGYKVPEGQTTYGGERGPSMDICER